MARPALLLATVAIACLTGAAAAATEEGNQQAAVRDAANALTLLRLPPGAERSDANPAANSQLLDAPGVGTSSNPNQIAQTEFWRVPGDPWTVIAWIKAHPPSGGRIVTEGRAGRYGAPAVWSVAFERRPVRNVLGARQLAVTVAAAAGGGTALRADGLATWVLPRPASERIPAGAEGLQVTIRGHEPTPVTRFAVRDSARVRLVERILNRLPRTQPGVYMCPMDRGIRAYLTFHGSDGRVAARAVAELGGCGAVRLTTAGIKQPDLNGYGLFDDLQAALGRRIDLTPFSGSDFTQPPFPVARIAHGRTIGGVPFDSVAYDGGPRSGVCVELFLAGVRRGIGCLLHRHGTRTSAFAAPACYPRSLTGVAVLGRDAATARVRFDDGAILRPTVHYLPHPTVTTTVGLQGDRIVKLKRPAKVSLGYRGPFAFGFRRGAHDLDTGYGPFSNC